MQQNKSITNLCGRYQFMQQKWDSYQLIKKMKNKYKKNQKYQTTYLRWCYLRAIAATIPPNTTPMVVAAMPMPITPSTYICNFTKI